MASAAMKVCKASATSFRGKFKDYVRKTKGRAVVLVENRRFESKYLVDKDWLDDFVKENESIKATSRLAYRAAASSIQVYGRMEC